MNEGKLFSDYISELREKEGFTIQEVCEGLCTVQEMHYLEKGERMIDTLLQDAVLERLGVGAEDTEIFLDYNDYKRWEDRHHILHSITFEEFQKAEELLVNYFQVYCRQKSEKSAVGSRNEIENIATDISKMKTEYRLEYQFYFSMMAQLRRCQGENDEELYHLFDRALMLTVPDYADDKVFKRAISIKELNLMLETEKYRKEGERPERFFKIVKYIDERKLDNRGRAKIYPKAVYYLCRCIMTRGMVVKGTFSDMLNVFSPKSSQNDMKEWTTARLLQYCDRAVNILRDNARMYFLWELLSLRETLLKGLEEEVREWQEQEGEGKILARMISPEPLQKENKEWKEVLEEVYRESGVPVETFEDCYLYVMKGVHCLNDVIRIRREMLGLSQKELCEEICDIRTLKSLERRESRPRREVVEELFERLGLSREFTRAELVTSSSEAKELWEKIKVYSNNGYWDKVEELLTRVEQLAPGEIRNNQQLLMRKKATLSWQHGEIDREEYKSRLQSALEVTIPYKAFLQEGEKYLTYGEQACIQNRMTGLKKGSKELLICMRHFEKYYSVYIEHGLIETVMGMYDFIMEYVGSKWGNEGEYDIADHYNGIIREGCLRFRRLSGLDDSLYDRWWNNKKRIEEGNQINCVLNAEVELTRCILLSELQKSSDRDFYQKKINSIKAKDI